MSEMVMPGWGEADALPVGARLVFSWELLRQAVVEEVLKTTYPLLARDQRETREVRLVQVLRLPDGTYELRVSYQAEDGTPLKGWR